jgi:hypothetical protein
MLLSELLLKFSKLMHGDFLFLVEDLLHPFDFLDLGGEGS